MQAPQTLQTQIGLQLTDWVPGFGGKAFGTAATRNGLEIGYETQSRNRARGEQVKVTYTTVYWYQTKSYIYGKSRRERTLAIRIRTDNVSLDVILVAAAGQSVSGFEVRIVLVACRGRTQRRHTAATLSILKEFKKLKKFIN